MNFGAEIEEKVPLGNHGRCNTPPTITAVAINIASLSTPKYTGNISFHRLVRRLSLRCAAVPTTREINKLKIHTSFLDIMGIFDLLPHLTGGKCYHQDFYELQMGKNVVPMDAAGLLWQCALIHATEFLRGNLLPALIERAQHLNYFRSI